MNIPKIDLKRFGLVSVTNFLLILFLFSTAFVGSLVSMATVEMAELNDKIKKERELIELDTSRIDVTQVEMLVPGDSSELTYAENGFIADQIIEQNAIVFFLEHIPLVKSINFLNLPDKVILSIAATFMGLLGSIIMLIKESLYNGLILNPALILKRSLLGFSSGLLVIVISYVLPTVITFDADVQIKFETLVTFSLFAGMFFEKIIERVNTKI